MDRQNQRFPLEFIRGKHTSNDDQLSLEADLIPGEYYLFTESDVEEPTDLFLNTYAEEAQPLEACDYPQFLEKALSSCAMQKSKKTYYYDHNEPEVFRCFSMTDSMCEYGYLFWYNGSDEGVLEEKVFLDNMVNLEATGPYNVQDFRVKVSPGKHKIVVFKRT